MFSIFHKKNTTSTDLSGLYSDMHSHLIPGIDDGAPDVETSLQMIRGMSELGYKKLITTPHIQWEMYKNTHEVILAGCESMKKELLKSGIPVELVTAAEYFMDDHFDELLDNDIPLLAIKDNLILVEFSFIRQPIDLKEKLFKMRIKGYQPIIAHPERYLYFGAHKDWYDQLREYDCLFQLNMLSLCGYYGKKQEELCHYLIKKKYVNLVGTDLHNVRHVQILKSSHTISDIANRLLDAGMLQNPDL
jgi:tyrosine-protein phosphatase YwqE